MMQEIQQLPLDKKFWVVEETIKSIKAEVIKHQMELSVKDLYEEYETNKELTIFTNLDLEHFYKAK